MEITIILIVVYILFYFSSRKESNAFDKAVNSRPKSEPYIWEDKESTAPTHIKWDFIPESKTRPHFGSMFMSSKDKKTYMRSNQWKLLKFQVLTLQNNQCKLCSSTHDLQLHHLTYERLGNEYQSDLVALCGQCHQNQHDHYGYDRTTDYSILIKPKPAE